VGRRAELTMRLFMNSLSASAGGGLTYVRNVIPLLAAVPGLQVTVAVGPGLRDEFSRFDNLKFVELAMPSMRRFWYEQVSLPGLVRRSRADILVSIGNFAVRNSPVPQILLSRNSIYTSPDFYRDLRSRREYRMWLDTRMRAVFARKSIDWADVTVAPSEAFAAELRRWLGVSCEENNNEENSRGKKIRVIHHGFDREAFTRDSTPLAAEVEEKLRATGDSLKLLFVSHYNYYRNFETLIRALPLLRNRCGGRKVKLLLTCKLTSGANPGEYRPETAAKLVRDLGVSDMVVELGAIRYNQLHHLYRRGDIYVSPAYTETFAHPLLEAMASGLPVVASDLPVHREICEAAALYFSCFSADELAGRVAEIALSADKARRLSDCGLIRSAEFSWKKHVDGLLLLAESLLAKRAS
jgi:glycosyltransferase involved in cell wall biosynthesis